VKRRFFISIGLIILAGLLGNMLRFTETEPDRAADFAAVPLALDRYAGREYMLTEQTEEVLKADLTTNRVYHSGDGSEYQLFMAYFGSQKYGSQIHSPKHCLPGGGWRIESIAPARMDIAGKTLEVNRTVLAGRGRRLVVFYWYKTRNGVIRNEYGLKLDLIKSSLLFRATDASIIRVSVEAGDNIETADERGREFISAFYPYMEKSLPF